MHNTGCFTMVAVLVLILLLGFAAGCSAPEALPTGVCAGALGTKVEKVMQKDPVILRSDWDPGTPREPAPEIATVTDDWLILVNKTHPLSKEYAPSDMVRIQYCVGDHAESMRYMRPEAAEHFHQMAEAAVQIGYEIGIRTAYRSYAQQYNIFYSYVARDGEEAANKYSARPGQSEHQTGLSADVTSPSVNYEMTTDYGQAPEGIWLAENAHRFGFIIRYPLGKEAITGYQYEPWHVRYVGAEAAAEIYERGITLEEYLGEVE
ncbi:MAG: M15 family metallopeptidase [Eubacteriales bacterium]|jgi:D-alanyl-D-alanine carboxypeptidase|nr:M15 family metallopeptidase [Eubacteriales bacterium]MDD3290048.1 M15 family metallopeptidase [Eubacteriales bacterium]MDD4444304.1 M15 family metallopeptidase [Eubacteriales bacterium]